MESQLAALSSKLGQLTLCLQTMQQQPAVAAGGSAVHGSSARWGGEAVCGGELRQLHGVLPT